MALRPSLENLRDLFLIRSCPGCGTALPGRDAVLCCWCGLRLYRTHRAGFTLPGTDTVAEGVFQHRGIPRELVIRLKYGGERTLARCAARLMADHSSVVPGPGDCLVPVAASRERVRERGFDHALLIARHLAQITGSCFATPLIREDRPPQVGLDEEGRRRNVRGAFSLAGPPPDDCRLWLIDDVMTTGSTICDAARALAEGDAPPAGALTLTYRDTLSGSII